MKISKYIVYLFLLVTFNCFGQINTNNTLSDNALIQTLGGSGVTISNVNINGAVNAYGQFTNGNSIGINQGVLLTSGTITNAEGPNNSPNTTTINGNGASAILNTIATGTTNDACVVTFDLVPCGTNLSFDYVFGSEEYHEFVNAGVNDVFGFFISGPGISGTQNIALVPSTSTPIAIDNVNNGNASTCISTGVGATNPQFFIDNCGGLNVEYDGLTTVLQAKINNLIPGQTYSITLAIADVGDSAYDSGVFISQASFLSPIAPNFQMKDEYCEDEAIIPVILPLGVTGYSWVINEYDANAPNGIIERYSSPYFNGPVTSVNYRNYWNGYQEGKVYAISIDYWTDCEGSGTLWSDFTIVAREIYSRCLDIKCGEIIDPNTLSFPETCTGELLYILDLVQEVSYEPEPFTLNKNTVLKLIYECCELFLCVNVANQEEIIYKDVCTDEKGNILMEACGESNGKYEYFINGLGEMSDESSRIVNYSGNGEYSVTTTSPEGCICKVIYNVTQKIEETVYATWCAGTINFDLSSIINPDCFNDIEGYTLINNITGEEYYSLYFEDPSGGYEIFGNGGAGDLLCLTYTSYNGDCIKCKINITLRFYDGGCDEEPEPIYCSDIYEGKTQESNKENSVDVRSENLSGFTILPNPSNGVYYLKNNIDTDVKTYNLKVTDVTGRAIMSKTNVSLNSEYVIDISMYPSGFYFLNLEMGTENKIMKLLKE